MGRFRIEPRADGSLVLTALGGARRGLAAAGVLSGALLLAGVVAGEVGVLGAVVVLPLGLITVLAGVAAARHRDWIVFDRRARQIVFRRGLAAMFRPVSTLPFDEVAAIVVEGPPAGSGPVGVALRREGDFTWPIDATEDPAYERRLVAALQDVGGWPVLHEPETAHP
jgi:hypothetical protein